MKKSLMLGATLLMGLSLAACGNSNASDSKSSSSSSSTSSTAASSNKAKITRSDFDNVQIGDLLQQSEGGMTIEEAKQKFGDPKSTTSSTTDDIQTDVYTWTGVDGKLAASMILSFANGKAFDKNLTGFKLTRKNKITLEQFNNLQNGASYNDVINELGEPDDINESLIGGTKNVIASYISGMQGDLGANMTLTFDNDALTNKSQMNLK